ncbi:MAG TPA: hypothetical protein DCK76_03545 [Desulfotomaculum sp.]|nr:hypothetical protein [Desulfotomaculum sp.]HBY04776.1 hypothetical protein [Desulfotomaculum sp.]
MTPNISNQTNRGAAAGLIDLRRKGLYKFGGVAALIMAALLVGEIVVYALFPRPNTALEHFAVFHDNWLVGLLTLDLLGMISYLVFVPTTLALYVALRRTSESGAAIGMVLFFIGIAAFFATNTAFSVLSLSNQYAAATTDSERAMFLAAGQAMFTLFNENAFLVSYVIVSGSWTIISGVMLRSNLFSRITAYAGILAGIAGILAVIIEHISEYSPAPALLIPAISLYFAAIVFLFIWTVLVGRRLLQLG